jgi:Flp pilus assembly protein TadG
MKNFSERMATGRNTSLYKIMKGQSMVEFALVLPVMVLIVAGIFDLGRAFFAYITITNAAREGARYGALNQDHADGICQATFNEALNSNIPIKCGSISVSCTATISCNQPDPAQPVCNAIASPLCVDNQSIIVKVGYDYDDMILKFFFPNPIHMERQVEMLVP